MNCDYFFSLFEPLSLVFTSSLALLTQSQLMPFLIYTIRRGEGIFLIVGVSATMEINNRIKEFVSGHQNMDIRFQGTDFDIVGSNLKIRSITTSGIASIVHR